MLLNILDMACSIFCVMAMLQLRILSNARDLTCRGRARCGHCGMFWILSSTRDETSRGGLGAATATCRLATDGLGSATVVQTLRWADLGARKKGGSGAAVGQRGNAFLTTDGLGSATVVRM